MRSTSLWLVIGSLAAIGLAVAASILPPLALLSLLAICIPLAPGIARRSAQVSIVLLLASPLLLSTFKLGTLTLDNAVTLAGLFFSIVWLFSQRSLRLSLFSVFPILIAVAIAVSAAVNGTDSIPAILRFVGIALIPIMVQDKRVTMPWTRGALVAIVTIGALSVLAQPLIKYPPPYMDFETGVLRYGGLMGHPNFAAYTFMLTVIFLLSRPKLRWFEWLSIGAIVAAIAATGSLGALAATAAGTLLVFARSIRRVLLVAAVAAVAVVVLAGPIIERLSVFGSSSSENSLTWRTLQWQAALNLVSGHEVNGIGWQQITENLVNGLGAHSAYVQLYVELGIVGVALAIVGGVAWVCAMRPRYPSAVLVGVTLVTSATDPVLLYPSTLTVLVLLLAIMRKEHEATLDGRKKPVRIPSRSTRILAT